MTLPAIVDGFSSCQSTGDQLRILVNETMTKKNVAEVLVDFRVACQRANWVIGGPRGAAARLGLKRTTLIYKMKRLGVRPPSDPEQD